MAGEIQRAADRFEERTEAAAAGVSASSDSECRQAIRASLSGFDLDFDELEAHLIDEATRAGIAVSLLGLPAANLYVTGWISGIGIGLLIAEARQKAEAS